MKDLLGRITGEFTGMLDTPWIWLVVFLVAGLDALLPFMPSEATLILVAVFIAHDPIWLLLLVAVGATGAMAGDWLGYVIGRSAGAGMVTLLERGERGQRMHAWARDQLERRGDLVIMVGRYVPGGRMAGILAAGALGYRPRRFLVVDTIATTVWATYATAIGFIGGTAFQAHPLVGLAVAFAIGLSIAIAIETTRRLTDRNRARVGE